MQAWGADAPETLSSIQAVVADLAARIGAAPSALPTYGSTEDGARPHVEVLGDQYHYVVVERGVEELRRATRELWELLFWIFSDVTHGMAFDHELQHRLPGRDGRRIAFPKQLELLESIDPAMAARRRIEIHAILAEYPFDDAEAHGTATPAEDK